MCGIIIKKFNVKWHIPSKNNKKENGKNVKNFKRKYFPTLIKF